MCFWVGQASCLPVAAASSRELMFARLIIAETSGRMPEEPAGWKPALHPVPSIASWREHSFGANSEFQILKSVFHPWLSFENASPVAGQASVVKRDAQAPSNLKLAIGNGRVKVSVQSSV